MKFPIEPFKVNRDIRVKYGMEISGFSVIKSLVILSVLLLFSPLIFM